MLRSMITAGTAVLWMVVGTLPVFGACKVGSYHGSTSNTIGCWRLCVYTNGQASLSWCNSPGMTGSYDFECEGEDSSCLPVPCCHNYTGYALTYFECTCQNCEPCSTVPTIYEVDYILCRFYLASGAGKACSVCTDPALPKGGFPIFH